MPRPRKVETRMQDAKAVGSHRTCSDLFVGPMGVAPGPEWSRLFEEGELLECAWSEVTHVVGLMALKHGSDAIAP